MKTEFLKGLGLEQDAIDKIMAENGKDVAAEKAKTTKVEGERDNYKKRRHWSLQRNPMLIYSREQRAK